ncbi:putative xyloglucan-specific endo-beta-1,4-glucanase [Helianthus annuus]|uniref:Xyloglucan-specific endo-beta-1,4-glucanase n=1 Tax=Helianthus annuus TaxID=4232 RepID=A0A9K3E754_HELAN|nr:putative xyloglucan-specific endo-beta-1,4-glucanase [Helianthus annuus]KAJ0838792.1 putative xyloglucan-specific endo-beta-1,4-glucanase [Helianthus annuus]KAJ0852082.1 putative xyloglucan-specific endo-beta-1,4-glucanase [Helianthus annuus]
MRTLLFSYLLFACHLLYSELTLADQLSSTSAKHDEIEFEFLGNSTGEPYMVHTNIYTQGQDNREQQFKLWFDPTASYHNYIIHWNPTGTVWYVDSVPIRVLKNSTMQRDHVPNQQRMRVYSSLWNANNWAAAHKFMSVELLEPFKAATHKFFLNRLKRRSCISNGRV